ncbi:hypothetical protein H9L21_07385 [Aeromicrobium senzhongii]|uniref:Uncharacterized protein n=1 Tax=Aeromicrobium senzhongii TaxID=2663859 RepID=A0ABX6SXA3_9ACTN|nr:hypothetical protein [Aeromicrobium senzhongii]MTB87212.1 hypothetical protein [Aeromicrobium senzhongii]QNL95713.1 hypothetical protein H9L21_07385 [Aeromicrobium senzhongii]
MALNYVVAYAILESRYGSVFFMSDDTRSSVVWVPLLVGVVVGCAQSLSFGFRVAAGASVLTVVLSYAFLFTRLGLLSGTLILCAMGTAAGWAVAWALARLTSRLVPASRLLLAAVVVASPVSVVVSKATAAGDEDFARVHTSSDGPAVLIRVGGDAHQHAVTGRLADVDGCLGIVDAAPVPVRGRDPRSLIEAAESGRAVVIWPSGTTVGSDPYTVSSEGRTYQLGDHVTVGGWWVRLDEDDPFYSQTPEACLANPFIS